jgi:hypothetical protein
MAEIVWRQEQDREVLSHLLQAAEASQLSSSGMDSAASVIGRSAETQAQQMGELAIRQRTEIEQACTRLSASAP